jgi:hypothetical protein
MLTLPDFFQGRSTGAEVNGLTHWCYMVL